MEFLLKSINPATIFNFLVNNTQSLLFTTVIGGFFLLFGKKAIDLFFSKTKAPILVLIKHHIIMFDDRALVLELVKWAEKKLPDKIGEEKKKIVTKWVAKLLPWLSEKTISGMIDYAVTQMNESLKAIQEGI